MVDRENREDWKRERSLLALGQAVRGEDHTVPIGERANASWREDAAARHRAARFEREGKSSPQPAGIGEFGQRRSEPASVEAEDEWSQRERYASVEQDDLDTVPDNRSQSAFEPRSARRATAAD